MKGNIWIVGYAIISLLLIGAAGAFSFNSKGRFGEADQSWSKLKKQINRLEAKDLYPSKANLEEITKARDEYETRIDTLFGSLKKFEKPLDQSGTASDFQQKLREYVEAFRKRGRQEGFTITQGENFYLGMDAYASDVPSKKLVPLLDQQLIALNRLATMMADSGVSEIVTLTRDNLPGERGTPPSPEPLPAVMRYPIRFEMIAGHNEFQTFINKLANDAEFFMVLRVLQVENTAKDGPAGESGNFKNFYPKFVDADGREASEELLTRMGYPDVTGEELNIAMSKEGWVTSTEDARLLFGLERVVVKGVIDLIRFTSPSELESSETATVESN